MREILFRGKDLSNGKWRYGLLVTGRTFHLSCEYAIVNDTGAYRIDPATIGQFTGRRDRNGREIFDGDILIDYHSTDLDHNKHLVIWNEVMFDLKPRYKDFVVGLVFLTIGNRTEVIGNVFDNPGLIIPKSVWELWGEFGDVPMNPETECIEVEWHGFPAGTHRDEIWHWFEDSFDVRVYDLMYGEEETT